VDKEKMTEAFGMFEKEVKELSKSEKQMLMLIIDEEEKV
jgi:hypothetical protein